MGGACNSFKGAGKSGGWCLPTKVELEVIRAKLEVSIANVKLFTLRGDTKKYSYFPFAGLHEHGSPKPTINQRNGYYWSSTPNGADNAYFMTFVRKGSPSMDESSVLNAYSVRCVKDVV